MLYLCLLLYTGIGHVRNLRFNRPSFSTIMWEAPPTAGVLSNLSYHLTVTNMNTGAVIINTTTTETSYPLSSVQHCTSYTAEVTGFSQGQNGGTENITERAPGGMYILSGAYRAGKASGGSMQIVYRM